MSSGHKDNFPRTTEPFSLTQGCGLAPGPAACPVLAGAREETSAATGLPAHPSRELSAVNIPSFLCNQRLRMVSLSFSSFYREGDIYTGERMEHKLDSFNKGNSHGTATQN